MSIQRSDLESKLREIESAVDQTKDAAKNTGVAIGIGVVVLLILMYLFGKKKGKKGSARVEVFRLG